MISKKDKFLISLLCLLMFACVSTLANGATETPTSIPTSIIRTTPSPTSIAVIPPAEFGTVCNSGWLHLRSAAGKSSTVTTVLTDGDTVEILNKSTSRDGGTWLRVKIGNIAGFVNAKYVCLKD